MLKRTNFTGLSIAVLVSLFGVACGTAPIAELTSKNSTYEDIIECRQFDKVLNSRLMTCNEDADCYELPMPRAADCYIPFSGNISEKEKLSDASRKCRELYRDEAYCEAPTPGRPVCRKSRCEMHIL